VTRVETLHVDRLAATYRLVPRAAGERARLDRVLGELLPGALTAAADAVGLDAREELCVRHVETGVRLRAAAHDDELARVWADALAQAIADAVTRVTDECHG
jgi:hypothetical protein